MTYLLVEAGLAAVSHPALAHRINTAVNGSGASSSGGNGGSRFGNGSNSAGGKVIFTILNFKCRIRGKGLC